MNRITHSIAYGTTVAAAAFAAALITGTAHAEGPIVSDSSTSFVSSRTRAEVRAEVIAAGGAARSTTNEWDLNQHTFAPVAGGPTRAQVAAEYISARTEVHARSGEDSGSAYLASRAVSGPNGAMLAESSYR